MRFLMDIIMPPSRNNKSRSVSGGGSNNNNNHPSSSDRMINCSSKNYLPNLLANLNMLRLNATLCDVEIIVGGTVIKAHKAILAASSPYFHAMFTGEMCERDKRSIELHDVSAYTLNALLDFIYSGTMNVSQSNVQELMIAADMLGLDDVILACSEYLIQELHAVNAVGIYRFAELHNCKDLKSAALQYIQTHFPQICKEEEIYELPKEQMIALLSSENLHVDTEFQVFQAAVRWITFDAVQRRRYVFEILQNVRLSLLPLGLLERAITECTDGSLKVALKSIHNDLVNRKGCLVPLSVHPRLRAKKHIFVIGGSKRELNNMLHKNLESNFATVERFDTFKREWCKAPNMSTARIVPGVACLNGCIYVVGGERGSNSLASGEFYNPQTSAWTKIDSMNVPRCEFGMCAWNGFLYAMGGWVGQGTGGEIGGSIERYNPHADTWTIVGNLLEPRFSVGVVAYEGIVYMVGGCTEAQRSSHDFLRFNPATGDWARLPPMHTPRSQMGVAVLDECLYVVGGNTRTQGLTSVERYSFKKKKWTTLPPMQVGRSGPAVAAVDGHLYVIGGYHTLENPFYRAEFTVASVECFNPLNNTWTDCPSLPESRAEAGAVVL